MVSNSEDVATAVAEADTTGYLHLSYMFLAAVPSSALRLTNLTRLDLGFNNLRELPPAIGSMRLLGELWVNNNPLTAIPRELAGCSALRVLLLQGTAVVKLPRELSRVAGLLEINLEATPALQPTLRDAYERGGTLGVMSFLRAKDSLRLLRDALVETLTFEVYREEGASPAGKAAIAASAKAVAAMFADDETALRAVIRNASRLFPQSLASFNGEDLRDRLQALQRDNLKKQLSADLELSLRARYYDRIAPEAVEGIVRDIASSLPVLDELMFLLAHAGELLPAEAKDIRGAALRERLIGLRAALAAELEAAKTALAGALAALYPEAGEGRLAPVVEEIAERLGGSSGAGGGAAPGAAGALRALAADAAECFPGDITDVRPRAVIRSFRALQQEKGLA